MKKIAYSYRKKRHTLLWVISLFFIFLLIIVFSAFKFFIGQFEWAGLTVSNLSPTLMTAFNIPPGQEGVVVRYVEGSAAYSGVDAGDLIKSINSKPVKNVREFIKVARATDVSEGVLLDVMRKEYPLFITSYNKKGLHENIEDVLSNVAGIINNNTENLKAMQVALTQSRLPSPLEQQASKKILVEGHWLGMEIIPLVPELAKEFGIAPNTEGILVDEVSLEAAESGILAGDMVLAVEGKSTPDIQAFTEATRRVKNQRSAKILVTRKGRVQELTIRSEQALGFSQNEAAQPIKPGALSPHRSRNKPCTACHIIMIQGGQLPTDAGDILPSPPPITQGAAPAHESRGNCNNCHIIITK